MTKHILHVFLLSLLLATLAYATTQITFETPEKAVQALISAAKGGDSSSVLALFGDDGKEIISSGDPVADKQARLAFLEAYNKKHHLVLEDSGQRAVILIGAQDWPFPIPLVKKENGWLFDTQQGKQEILYRRIGRDELSTIQACLAYVDAQNDYAQIMRKESGKAIYAQRIISSEGHKDGLYWPAATDENESPLGEMMAAAAAEGYGGHDGRNPYHGYYYKILTRQGPSASGGALDYVVQGNMIGGFGLIAWPAAYGNSGVMSFIVNHDGVVYQKDLGPETAKEASKIDAFDPAPGWDKVEAANIQ